MNPGHPDLEALERRFNEYWAKYSRLADDSKRRYKRDRLFSRPVLYISWLMLLLAIGSRVSPEMPLNDIAPYLVPGFGAAVIVAGIYQMIRGHRQFWIIYRTATEHLREAYFRFRVGLPPFDGANAAGELDREISRVNKYVQEMREAPAGPLVALIKLSKMEISGVASAPAAHLALQPRFVGADLDRAEAQQFLYDNLAEAQHWHFSRAKSYLRRLVVLQSAVLLATGAGVAVSQWYDSQLWVLGILGAVNILIMQVVEFFDLTALCQRYCEVVAQLRRLGHEYRCAEGDFHRLDEHQRRQLLAREFDQLIAREFDYWHARSGKTPYDRPGRWHG